MKNHPNVAIQVPTIYLPKSGTDLTKWSVIACDQYTSQPAYWKTVADLVSDAPSTYHMILPEAYLGKEEEAARLQSTQQKMREYLDQGILIPREYMIYVERSVSGKTRRGIMMALDLEHYDYSAGSQSLIRPTEGTIVDRLPPRMRIREGADLELPHILVLIDDPRDTVIGQVEAKKNELGLQYDFDLMQSSGHLTGRAIDDSNLEEGVFLALEELAKPDVFYPKYGVKNDKGILLYAVGDGNHSLATAKSIWEKIKPQVGMNHPARYALVEIENIHDSGLEFEPIHRVLFNFAHDPLAEMREFYGDFLEVEKLITPNEMKNKVSITTPGAHHFGVIDASGFYVITIRKPSSNLAVGTLQTFLDYWLENQTTTQVDYVHGDEVVIELGQRPGNVGFYLPAMAKNELFRTVILDGVLPRKTFSMGEAHEKRFYMEARKIIE